MYKKCEEILNYLKLEGRIKVLDTFKFPEKQVLKLRLKDMLEDNVDEKYYLSEAMVNYCLGVNQKQSKFPRGERFIQNINRNNQDIGVAISTNPGNRPVDNFVKIKDGEITQEPCQEISTGENKLRIRKLTPKECWRLMGFHDDEIERASKVCSNSQLYKQAGNSIVVNVLEEIFKNLFRGEINE